VSQKIKMNMAQRLSHFNIILDDVSIVQLTFGPEFTKAIEEKQVAMQKAERAKFLVEIAIQDKKSTLIKASGEAKSAEFFGKAMSTNPAYIDLKRVEAARDIAKMLGQSRNKVYLDSDSLLLNLTQGLDKNLEKKPPSWMVKE
jgi:prohibitin 2